MKPTLTELSESLSKKIQAIAEGDIELIKEQVEKEGI